METMIAQYSKPWQTVNRNAEPGMVVLLTGSTGNIGSHILEALLRDSRILRIYAFNRPSPRQPEVSLLDRHRERFEDKGFDKALLASEKLVFLEGDASQDDLGVSPLVLNEVYHISLECLKQRAYLTLLLSFVTLLMSSSILLGDSTLIYPFPRLTQASGVRETWSTSLMIALTCRDSNLSSLLPWLLLFHGIHRKVHIPKKLSWMHVSPLAMAMARANMCQNGYFSFYLHCFIFGSS